MSTVATLWVKLGLDSKGYKDGLTEAEQKSNSFAKSMQKTGTVMTAAITTPIVGAGIAAVKMASTLEESLNASNVVFGKSNKIIQDYGETVAETAGLSRAEFSQMAAVTGAFLKNVGFDAASAAQETIKLTERASDMASIFNTDVSTALNAIQSGLKGEFNPLEQFGVKMNAAGIEARAMSMGLADANGNLSDAAKAQAALALVMEQTNQFAGDFTNTADGLANSTKILKAKFTDAAASLGQQLLPMAIKVVDVISKMVDKFANLTDGQQKTIVVIAGVVAAIGPLLMIAGKLTTSINAITTATKAAGVASTATGSSMSLAFLAPIAPIAAMAAALGLLLAGLVSYQKGVNEAKSAQENMIPQMGTLRDYSTMQKGSFDSLGKSVAATTNEYSKMEDALKSLNSTAGKDYTKNLINAGYYQVYNNATGLMETRKRAAGGSALAGSPYMVGERGPELFVPGQSGNVIPNNKLGGNSDPAILDELRGLRNAFDKLPTAMRDLMLMEAS